MLESIAAALARARHERLILSFTVMLTRVSNHREVYSYVVIRYGMTNVRVLPQLGPLEARSVDKPWVGTKQGRARNTGSQLSRGEMDRKVRVTGEIQWQVIAILFLF